MVLVREKSFARSVRGMWDVTCDTRPTEATAGDIDSRIRFDVQLSVWTTPRSPQDSRFCNGAVAVEEDSCWG
jgi:hypothetical protein